MKTKTVRLIFLIALLLSTMFHLSAQTPSMSTWMELKALVDDLTIDCHSDYEKGEALFNWIGDNISYDVKTAESVPSSDVFLLDVDGILVDEFIKSKHFYKLIKTGLYDEARAAEIFTEFLVKRFPSISTKTKAAYKTMMKNPDYQQEMMAFNSQHLSSGLSVFEQRKGICSGIANLYQIMCEMAGIQCDIVCGIARNDSVMAGHAWNALLIDGQMILAAPTAGITSDKTSYFDVQPFQLAMTHLPYNAKYQNLANIVTIETFTETFTRKMMEGFTSSLELPVKELPKKFVKKVWSLQAWYITYTFRNSKNFFPQEINGGR